MTISWRFARLATSHCTLFLLALFATHACTEGRALQALFDDPYHRLGVRLSQEPGTGDTALVEDDLAAVRAELGAEAADAVRLALQLHESDLAGATSTCTRLGWRSCDSATITRMQATLAR